VHRPIRPSAGIPPIAGRRFAHVDPDGCRRLSLAAPRRQAVAHQWASTPRPRPQAGEEAATNTQVILLVDDNADDVTLTLTAFQRSGLNAEIIVARDGVEALALLLPADRTQRLCPALVLLDINMPRIGGMEVLRTLQGDPATRPLPVIMLTSSADDRDMIESYGLGANAYVQKPVNSDEFLAAAQALGVFWLNINKQPPPHSH
jgi:two-component system response regulator